MNNYYILNFKGNFIKDNIDILNNFSSSWGYYKENIDKIITEEGLDYIRKLNVNPFNVKANIYVGHPNESSHIHSDTPPSSKISYAINYVWGDSDLTSKMFWYKQLNNGTDSTTFINTKYLVYQQNDVELIEEIEVPNNTLFLVRINVPHMVTNYSNNKRFCFSIRGEPYLAWNNVQTYFKNFIL